MLDETFEVMDKIIDIIILGVGLLLIATVITAIVVAILDSFGLIKLSPRVSWD